MRSSMLTGAAAAAAALALVLTGCGSDTKTAESSSTSAESSTTSSTSSAAETTSEAAPAPAGQTVAEYINENGITQTVVEPGGEGVPMVDLPTPEGWVTTQEGLPEGSYGGVRYTGPDANPEFPPTIFAYLSRLDGDVDPATLLSLAGNELKGLPDYQGNDGAPGTLSGFEAYEIAGVATLEGAPRFVAQKTVMIPGADGLYMLLLNAYSMPDQQAILGTAMGQIENGTTITP